MANDRAILIGPGEVGRRLGGALERAGWTVATVTRTSGWDTATDAGDRAPRIVAVREDDLGDVLDRLGPALRPRTVLVQNGFLEAVHGDLGPVTRGLIWFMSKKDVFRELTTSLFYGPLAGDLVVPLARSGLAVARIEERERALREMILKGLWNCLVGLPLAVHETDLATYRREREDELRGMLDEGCAAAGPEFGVTVTPEEALVRIDATIGPIGFVRGGAKALPWRNGAIAAFGRRHRVPTPVTDRLLRAVGFDPDEPPAAGR